MTSIAHEALSGVLSPPSAAPVGELSAWTVGGAEPVGVALPASPGEVAGVLAAARAAGVGVVPLGNRTETGCASPALPFVALGTAGLAGIEAYEPADLTVTAAAGTPFRDLVEATARHGQWLPFDPPRAEGRTLGGLVATGAPGPLAAAFGSVRDHVLGLTVVTGDGRTLRLGGRVMKNVAGFDLVRLVVGSRGVLGVIVSATLRVFPRPEADHAWVLPGESLDALIPVARRIATASVVPASAVLTRGPGGSLELLLRVAGAGAGVAVEERRLLGGDLGRARRLADDERRARLAADAPGEGALVVKASGLPADLADVLADVEASLPDAMWTADVLTGRVRAGTHAAVAPTSLSALRERLRTLGGSLVLERASPQIVASVGVTGAAGIGAELAASLRASFDPHGTLGLRAEVA
ncbi:MAG TPA: FAD-binding protein [Longimicrobiales bacterium]|nr:FAD-binding protein [Longimicrobiales bacterium]